MDPSEAAAAECKASDEEANALCQKLKTIMSGGTSSDAAPDDMSAEALLTVCEGLLFRFPLQALRNDAIFPIWKMHYDAIRGAEAELDETRQSGSSPTAEEKNSFRGGKSRKGSKTAPKEKSISAEKNFSQAIDRATEHFQRLYRGVLPHSTTPPGKQLCYLITVHLGDLERYREATPSKPPSAGSTTAHSQAARTYLSAVEMLPDHGLAFNQLAIMSQGNGDTLLAVYYYLRAAAANGKPFKHAVRNYRTALERFGSEPSDPASPSEVGGVRGAYRKVSRAVLFMLSVQCVGGNPQGAGLDLAAALSEYIQTNQIPTTDRFFLRLMLVFVMAAHLTNAITGDLVPPAAALSSVGYVMVLLMRAFTNGASSVLQSGLMTLTASQKGMVLVDILGAIELGLRYISRDALAARALQTALQQQHGVSHRDGGEDVSLNSFEAACAQFSASFGTLTSDASKEVSSTWLEEDVECNGCRPFVPMQLTTPKGYEPTVRTTVAVRAMRIATRLADIRLMRTPLEESASSTSPSPVSMANIPVIPTEPHHNNSDDEDDTVVLGARSPVTPLPKGAPRRADDDVD